MPSLLESLLDGLLNASGRATVVSIDGTSVSIRVGGSPTVLRNVPVVGSASLLEAGQVVPVLWISGFSKGKIPVVLGSGVKNAEAANTPTGEVHADEATLTELAGVLSVREGGVEQKHLNFSPALVGHTHPDPLTEAGWSITPDGILTAGGMYIHPQGMISIGQSPEVVKIDSQDPAYRIWAGNVDPALANFVVGKDGWVFIKEYVESKMLDLELMKMQFQSISWAQFAVFDSLDDESKRASPEPGAYPARVLHGKLDNGGDVTPNRAFTFTSKTFGNITTLASGTSTSVGEGFLADSSANWFAGQWQGCELVDSSGAVFQITANTPTQLSVSGGGAGYSYTPIGLLLVLTQEVASQGGSAPSAGAYTIRSKLPGYLVGFCTFQDASNGGSGQAGWEISFDGGANWQTLLGSGINRLGGVNQIANPGRNYKFRLNLTNDGSGNGAVVHKLLFCTDPSIWP